MILNHLPISAYSGVLKFDMKIFVNVARLEIEQLFTQGARRWHPCILDKFLVLINFRTHGKILYLSCWTKCFLLFFFLINFRTHRRFYNCPVGQNDFSSPEQRSGRAIVLPPASALGLVLANAAAAASANVLVLR